MSDRKEFNNFCDKNGITNLTAGLQLFENSYKEAVNIGDKIAEIKKGKKNPFATVNDVMKELKDSK